MATSRQTKAIKFPLPARTDDQKYAIADSIANSCMNLPADTVSDNRKFYFREVINSQVSIRGQRVSVAQAFQEDDALHITNLVLNRLTAPRLVATVANVEEV